MPSRKKAPAHSAVNTIASGKIKGARELSKSESQQKIMLAARQLLAELGYETATMRQIAAKAGLTVGALFNHVSGKRDLIYLVFNDEVDKVVEIALASPRSHQSLGAKILSVTEHYTRMFGREPELSRILLAEVVTLSPGLHLNRYLTTRAKLLEGIRQMVAEAQQAGEIKTREEAEVIARHIFFLFAASLRWWLASSERPDWREGHRDFGRSLDLLIYGLRDPVRKGVKPTKLRVAAENTKKRQTRR